MRKSLLVVTIVFIASVFCGSVQAATFNFTHSGSFTIANQTRSSNLTVNGVTGNVTDVNVTLTGLKANNSSDGIEEFDVLLVGPQGTSVILISFVCDFTDGPVNFTFDNSASSNLPQGDGGTGCSNGVYRPSDYHIQGGGYTIVSPPAPPTPYSTNLSSFNGTNPNGTWTIYSAEYFDSHQGGTIQSRSITITTDGADTECSRFSDEFNNNVVSWDIVKPIATESGGNTTLTPATKKSEIDANNVFAGCGVNCTVDTEFQTAGGIGGKVWVLGWLVDNRNLIEVLIREDQNRVTVRQRINRTIVAKSKGNHTINPNTLYTLSMNYNGSDIRVFIDGSLVATLNPVGNISGSVGLRSTNTTSKFSFMCVD